MKKAFSVFLVALFLISTAASAFALEIKLAHVVNEKDSFHLAAEKFKTLTEKYTNGSVTVAIFPNAKLGDERTLLESIMLPSKQIDEKYRLSRYLMTDGTVVTGRPIAVAATQLTIQTNSLPIESISIKREEIEQTSQADISPMPADLIDVLTLDEILDLMAYLKANGDPQADAYR